MSKSFRKNEKKITIIFFTVVLAILIAMVAWIVVDAISATSNFFKDQTFAKALADALDCTAFSLDEDDIKDFEVMVVSCHVSNDSSNNYSIYTVPYVTLGKADYADYIIEKMNTMYDEEENDEEDETSSDSSDTSSDEPKFDTVTVYAAPTMLEDILKFTNLRVFSAIDSSTAYSISYDTYYANMYSQYLGGGSTITASSLFSKLVPQGLTTLNDLAPLTKLEYIGLAYSGLTNFEGIDNFPNLAVLDATEASLTTVAGVEKASGLIGLYVGGNELTDISGVEKLDKLQTLEIASNKIEKLPVLTSGSLINISMSENSFTSLKLDLPNLRELYVSGNDLKTIELNLPSATTVDLSGNSLTDISSLAASPLLENLVLSGNVELTDISPISGCTGLKSLYIVFEDKDEGKLSDISPLAGMTGMTDLSITYTQVSDISVLAGMTEMSNLTLANNLIDDISVLSGMTKLTTLNLSGNSIEDVSPLPDMKLLTTLNLSDNRIATVASLKNSFDAEVITSIDLSGNRIIDFTPLDSYSKATINKDDNGNDKETSDTDASEADES
ncbi:MAG: leucine-rich repeat domain-containing protein [Clostridiales bacterium]|nr:leucine-rich repeat domain-containing protein [Clostridiales bacterium]